MNPPAETRSGSLVLLTGATGYVGGRLLRSMQTRRLQVRCLARNPDVLQGRVAPTTEIVAGDVLDEASVRRAMEGVHTAYYLIHSMESGQDFGNRDRQAAELFGRVARAAGVERVIYLGGLGHGPNLSDHLASRQEVGRILRESGVPTIEFRASIIIGSGSLSFEMIRALVRKLPVMTTPTWVRTLAQPIAIEDVIAYLLAALDLQTGRNEIFEIGGPDRASYLDIMREYARQRGLSRLIVPVPVLTPRLSSLWLRLVTPLHARVGRRLIESIRNETIVRDDSAVKTFPVRPRSLAEAIDRSLKNEDQEFAQTRWSDALSSSGAQPGFGGTQFGERLIDSRSLRVSCPPPRAFRPIQRIGGTTGWYYADSLWRIRGLIDLLVGGVGLRRGRRHPREIAFGDTIDFWRVEALEPDRLLRLRAEMRLPGRAWLQFEVDPDGDGSIIRQTAIFEPIGLFGLVYWYSLYPLHKRIFAGMLEEIAHAAERERGNGSRANPHRVSRDPHPDSDPSQQALNRG